MGHGIGHVLNQAEGLFNIGPDAQNKKQLQKAMQSINQQQSEMQQLFTPPPPPPPTTAQAAQTANLAADAAAAAQRKKAMANTGYAGTILTNPSAPPPSGTRKTLLGI